MSSQRKPKEISSKRLEMVKRAEHIRNAQRLAALGARPPTISALIPYLPPGVVKDVYHEVTGRRSPRGPTAYTVHAHFATPISRIKSSYALVTFLQYRNSGIRDVDAIIATYNRYRATFDQAHQSGCGKAVNFDQMWALIRDYLTKFVNLTVCPYCGHLHIQDPAELITERNCLLQKLGNGPEGEDLVPKPVKRRKNRTQPPAPQDTEHAQHPLPLPPSPSNRGGLGRHYN